MSDKLCHERKFIKVLFLVSAHQSGQHFSQLGQHLKISREKLTHEFSIIILTDILFKSKNLLWWSVADGKFALNGAAHQSINNSAGTQAVCDLHGVLHNVAEWTLEWVSVSAVYTVDGISKLCRKNRIS